MQKVTTVVKSEKSMSNRGYYRNGKPNWWLRSDQYGFIRFGEIRGDCTVDIEVDLYPGEYTLGVGKGKDAIRTRIVVEPQADEDIRAALIAERNSLMARITEIDMELNK